MIFHHLYCSFIRLADATRLPHFMGWEKEQFSKKVLNIKALIEISNEFVQKNALKEHIESFGKRFAKLMYGGKEDETLHELRYKKLVNKVVKANSFVKPERIPPTEITLKYHSYRSYLQVQNWCHPNEILDPKEWGWKEVDGEFVPVTSDHPAAPPELLKIIRCSCKTDCSSSRCSCRKSNILCSETCKYCQMNDCCNIEKIDMEEYLLDDDDFD